MTSQCVHVLLLLLHWPQAPFSGDDRQATSTLDDLLHVYIEICRFPTSFRHILTTTSRNKCFVSRLEFEVAQPFYIFCSARLLLIFLFLLFPSTFPSLFVQSSVSCVCGLFFLGPYYTLSRGPCKDSFRGSLHMFICTCIYIYYSYVYIYVYWARKC